MKDLIKLLAFTGAVVGATAVTAIAIDRRRRRITRGGERETPFEDTGLAPDVVVVDAEIIGLADVDPAALTQMGEAIDPELTEAAHEEIPEQRERMPVRGKNVP